MDHKSLVWLHLLYNSSNFPSYTGWAGTMVTPMVALTGKDVPFESSFVPVQTMYATGLSTGHRGNQTFDSELTGSSEDTDLIHIHSGEDWVALLDDDLSQPTAIASDSFHISALQKEDPVCITLSSWISSRLFPTWTEVRGLCPELRLLWHHRNNLTVDDNGIIWRKRSTQESFTAATST